MTGEKNCRQFRLQYPLVYLEGWDEMGVKGGDGEEIVILARYRVHFVIEHEILV